MLEKAGVIRIGGQVCNEGLHVGWKRTAHHKDPQIVTVPELLWRYPECGHFVSDISLDRLGSGDIGIARGAVAFLNLGDTAAEERSRQFWIAIESGINRDRTSDNCQVATWNH
jgi:hypothetical protein